MAHEHRQRLIGNRDMPFEAFDLARHTVEATRQGRFETFGAIRRKVRGERRLDNERLGDVLPRSIIGELSREIRRQAERVLGAHPWGHMLMSSAGSRLACRAIVLTSRKNTRERCASSSVSSSSGSNSWIGFAGSAAISSC